MIMLSFLIFQPDGNFPSPLQKPKNLVAAKLEDIMEHLLNEKERRERQDDLQFIPSIPWFGFDHDEHYYPLVSIQEYPLLRGWSREDIEHLMVGNTRYRSSAQELAMIQSWMFFGLLESAFNERFKTTDFIIPGENGQLIVQTTYLRKWIDDYHSRINLHPTTNHSLRKVQQTRLVNSLLYASIWNQRLVDQQVDGRSSLTNSDIFDPVTRLITLIGEAVWAVAQVFPSLDGRFFIDCDWAISEGNELELRARVESRGWCPSLTNKIKLLSRTSTSFLEYVSLISSPEIEFNPHDSCSLDHCVAYNVNVSEYRTKHRTFGCKCQNIGPLVRDVENALREWTIPVLNGIDLINLDSPTVLAYSPENPIKFVAFSHVWSDGLGSVTEDGIPKCQVEYLLDLAIQAARTPFIWIDSLCVPRDPEIRGLAISMMAETYKSAEVTVVLDDMIKGFNSNQSLETKMIALSLSKWQERLWTLQESSLAKQVLFAFENDLVKASATLKHSGEEIHRPVIKLAHLLLDNLSNWVEIGDVTIGGLQRNLCRRTSSRPDDETLAIAPFLNLDISKLLQVQGENRMIRFWEMVKHVPRGILFHDSGKISRDGFGWAPSSLMNQRNVIVLDFKDKSATVTKDGLKGKYWIYDIQVPTPVELKNDTFFYDSQSDCVMIIGGGKNLSNLSISNNHSILVEKDIQQSSRAVAAILSRVSNETKSQIPIYKYLGIMVITVARKTDIVMAGQPEEIWDFTLRRALGQLRGQLLEVIVR